MDADIKKKWVEALRSGKYKQGKGCLKDASGKFCCLGVLCDLLGTQWELRDSGMFFAIDDSATQPSYLSPRVAKLAAVTPNEEGALSAMNDDGDDFLEIADYVEANL